MKIAHKDQGDAWVPQATFTINTAPTDPTTITVKIRKPDGTTSSLGPVDGGTGGSGIVRASAGVYYTTIPLTDAGYWYARFEGTGAAAGAEDHQVIVDPSVFYETGQLSDYALVGLAETKDWLQQQNIDTESDLELARVINDISERFTDEAGREFKAYGTQPSARLFHVDHELYRTGVLRVGDLAAPPTLVRFIGADWTSVISTVPSTDYLVEPAIRRASDPIVRLVFNRRVMRARPGMRVEVTGTFGFPAVPGNVRQAVLDAIAVVMDRDVEHYTLDQSLDTLSSGQGGGAGNVIFLSGRPMILSLPPIALAVARSYSGPLVA